MHKITLFWLHFQDDVGYSSRTLHRPPPPPPRRTASRSFGNEVDVIFMESYNSTTNISGVLQTRQASKCLRPLNESICPLDSSLCVVDYHFFHSYDSTTITRGLLQTRQAPKFPRGGAPGISWWGCAARFFKS